MNIIAWTYVGIIAIALVILGLAWGIRRNYIRTVDDFLVAGRKLGPALTGASMLAAWTNALTVSVNSQFAYVMPFPNYMVVLVFALTLPLLLAIPLAGKVRAIFPNGYSNPGFLRARYGKGMHIYSIVSQVVLHLFLLIVQLMVGSAILSAILKIPAIPIMVVLTVVAIANIVIGGMWSSAATDYLQIGAAIIAIVILSPLTILHMGGPATIFANILHYHPADMTFSFKGFWPTIISVFLTILTGLLAPQYVWQRFFSARDERAVTRSFSILTFAYIGMAFTGAIPALVVLSKGIALPAPDASPVAYLQFIPGWGRLLMGLIILTFVFSVTDSTLNAIVPMVSRDLMQYRRTPTPVNATRIGQVAALIFGIIGIIIALADINTVQIFFWIGAITLTLTGPILLGILTKRVKDWHATVGTLLGAAVGFYYASNSFASLMTALFIPIVVTLALSLINPGTFDWHQLQMEKLDA